MLDDDVYRCRVCGLRLDDPPWGADGHTPLYEHCPCCGVEFGYQDAAPVGAKRFREKWLAAGGEWQEAASKPPAWDLAEQLRHVPKDFE